MKDFLDSKSKYSAHVENVKRKHEALEVKRTLLAMYEEMDEKDVEYIKALRKKVRNLSVQLSAMRFVSEDYE